MGHEQLRLDARRIIFGERGDLLEQRAAGRIVKEAARDAPGRLGQAAEDGFGKVGKRRPPRLAADTRGQLLGKLKGDVALHHASPASLTPENCQR